MSIEEIIYNIKNMKCKTYFTCYMPRYFIREIKEYEVYDAFISYKYYHIEYNKYLKKYEYEYQITQRIKFSNKVGEMNTELRIKNHFLWRVAIVLPLLVIKFEF